MKNVALINFNDRFYQDVALNLAKNHTDIRYIIGHLEESRKFWKKTFPSAIQIPLESVMSLTFLQKENQNNPLIITPVFLKKYDHITSLFLAMTDRLVFRPITVQRRMEYYFHYLRYFANFLERKELNNIIFDSAPHMGYDFVLFHLARDKGIKICFPERTLLNNKLVLLNNYVYDNKVPDTFIKNANNQNMSKLLNKEYSAVLKEKSNILSFAQEMHQTPSYGIKHPTRRFVTRILFQNPLQKIFSSAFALQNNDSKTNRLNMAYAEFLKNRKYKKLSRDYLKYVKKVSLKKNYVFFPLHFQPERTTLPLGGIFHDQLTSLSLLRAGLPDNIYIYVKEHPRQIFAPRINSMNVRETSFYSKIVSHKKVILLDYQKDNFSLIKNALFTFTIAGSAGWESILMGRPVMVLGYPWYGPCMACCRVSSVVEIKKAFNDLTKMTKQEVRMNLLKFILYYQQKNKFVTSVSSYKLAKQSNISYPILVNNYSQAVINFLSEQ